MNTNIEVVALLKEKDSQEDPKKVATRYARAIRLDPNRVAGIINLGQVHQSQKQYNKAIRKYLNATIIEPTYFLPYHNWSKALYEQGKILEALKVCELCYKEKVSIEILNHWALLLQKQGRYDEAIAKYQEALDLDPMNTGTYLNYGVVLRKQGKYEEAIWQFKIILNIDPYNIDAYNNWGVILYHQHKYHEAADVFIEVTKRNPYETYAYMNWGFALHQLGIDEEAKKVYLRGLEYLKGRPIATKNFRDGLTGEIGDLNKRLSYGVSEDEIKHLKTSIEGMEQLLELLKMQIEEKQINL